MVTKDFLPFLALPPRRRALGAFTLIEIIIVLALLAGMYTYMAPNFSMVARTTQEMKVQQILRDFQSAYDLSVLEQKPLRLVFQLSDNSYWLEEQKDPQGSLKLKAMEDETEEPLQNFEQSFALYQELQPPSFPSPSADTERIQILSPVMLAKARLAPAAWKAVKNMEWRKKRRLGPQLRFCSFWSPSLEKPLNLREDSAEGRFFFYFLAGGHIDKLHLELGDPKKDWEDKPQENFHLLSQPHKGSLEWNSDMEKVGLYAS